VIEQLYALDPIVKPMFGCHAIYIQNKIVLMLRCKEDFSDDNGVWVSIAPPYKTELKEEIPTLRSIGLFGKMNTTWQNIPQSSDTFEEDIMRVCELILKHDQRIGKIPKAKKKA
jgi:hypothetical protein